MDGFLLQAAFHVVIDEDGLSLRLLTHDLEAVEAIWAAMLGSTFQVQTAIDPLLGSGVQLVMLGNASVLYPDAGTT